MPTINPPQTGSSSSVAPVYSLANNGLTTTVVTANSGGGVGTKSTAQSIGTLSADIDRLELRMLPTASRAYLIDVYNNGTKVVEDLPVFATSQLIRRTIPLRLTAGSLQMYWSCNAATQAFSVLPYGYTSDVVETRTRIEPLGTVGTSAFTTGIAITPTDTPTPSAWTQIFGGTACPTNAGLANAVKGLILSIGNNNDTTRTSLNYIVELATGEAAAQVALPAPILYSGNTTLMAAEHPPVIDVVLPAGTKVWARVMTLGVTGNDGPVNVQIHGVR